jgi:hypothetical protein
MCRQVDWAGAGRGCPRTVTKGFARASVATRQKPCAAARYLASISGKGARLSRLSSGASWLRHVARAALASNADERAPLPACIS